MEKIVLVPELERRSIRSESIVSNQHHQSKSSHSEIVSSIDNDLCLWYTSTTLISDNQ